MIMLPSWPTAWRRVSLIDAGYQASAALEIAPLRRAGGATCGIACPGPLIRPESGKVIPRW
jgi:hypothetical protein